jgi:hypothetical protein
MNQTLEAIRAYEAQIRQAFAEIERSGRLSEALAAYQEIERGLEGLDVSPAGAAHHERQRALAACLDRQAHLLRQLGRLPEAGQAAARQLEAARASGELVTIAYALLSSGHTRLLGGDQKGGEHALSEARRLFESGDSPEQQRGLGKYWTLQAELHNQGALPGGPAEAQQAATRALEALAPLQDWDGVARAYLARASAHAALGDNRAAAEDRVRARRYKATASSR